MTKLKGQTKGKAEMTLRSRNNVMRTGPIPTKVGIQNMFSFLGAAFSGFRVKHGMDALFWQNLFVKVFPFRICLFNQL